MFIYVFGCCSLAACRASGNAPVVRPLGTQTLENRGSFGGPGPSQRKKPALRIETCVVCSVTVLRRNNCKPFRLLLSRSSCSPPPRCCPPADAVSLFYLLVCGLRGEKFSHTPKFVFVNPVFLPLPYSLRRLTFVLETRLICTAAQSSMHPCSSSALLHLTGRGGEYGGVIHEARDVPGRRSGK